MKINIIKQILSIVGILALLFLVNIAGQYVYDSLSIPEDSFQLDGLGYGDECNVQGIALRGEIYTYIPKDKDGYAYEGFEDAITSEEITYLISEAEYNENIKAILIEVDSYGGSPVAGEEIANEIKLTTKPVVAFIRDAAASAAYMAISSADKIFASKYSDIGSIGVTMSYLDYSSKNQKEGISYIQLSTGKFKNAGDPNKSVTAEEKDLFMRDLEIMHENFVKNISENRNIAIEKVKAIADGSTVLGEKAKELGLIDDIGDYYSATDYIASLINEEAGVCW